MTNTTILKRRDGAYFRYSLTFLDSANVAILEIDSDTDPNARREPTRRLCVAHVSHVDELQDLCDYWNSENEATEREISSPIDFRD